MSHGPGGPQGFGGPNAGHPHRGPNPSRHGKPAAPPSYLDQLFNWIFQQVDPVIFLTSFLAFIVFCLFLIKTASRKRYLERLEEERMTSKRRTGTPVPRSDRPGGRTAKAKKNVSKFIDPESDSEDSEPEDHIDRDPNLSHSDSDYDSDTERPSTKKKTSNDKRKGTKWLAKQQAKEEKRKFLEQQKKERAEAKKKEDEEYENRKKLEREEELKEKQKEEEKQRLQEIERQKQEEEYNQMKADFEIEEEGEDNDEATLENEKDLLNKFIDYIKTTKMVDLEELASKFSLKTTDCIDRIRKLMEDDTLTGIIDDRGKFIYITKEEMEAVAQYINQKGRVSKSELSKNSGKLVNLEVKQ